MPNIMFVILTAFGLLVNFMIPSYNLSLVVVVHYSWRPQLAKQSLYIIFPLPFNVSYFWIIDIDSVSVFSTHTTLVYVHVHRAIK